MEFGFTLKSTNIVENLIGGQIEACCDAILQVYFFLQKPTISGNMVAPQWRQEAKNG